MPRKKQTKPAPREPAGAGRIAWDWAKTIGLALLLALVIRSSLVGAYSIPSGSMLQTLQLGDQLLVSKVSYRLKLPFSDTVLFTTGEIQRGDIVVFDPPFKSQFPYIKRVIGLPGDTVQIRDKQVYVNGRRLKEPYVRHSDRMVLGANRRDQMPPTRVPPGKLFVMGDNRDDSEDSRFWGFADAAKVHGKALVIYWSWDWSHMRPRWSRLGTILD